VVPIHDACWKNNLTPPQHSHNLRALVFFLFIDEMYFRQNAELFVTLVWPSYFDDDELSDLLKLVQVASPSEFDAV